MPKKTDKPSHAKRQPIPKVKRDNFWKDVKVRGVPVKKLLPVKPVTDFKPEVVDLIELASRPFADIIEQLERAVPGPGWMPGTTLTRIILTNDIAVSYGLQPHDLAREGGSHRAWCLTLGKMGERQLSFYGWDITEAVTNAAKALFR